MVDPIDPILKTSRTPTRKIYSVSGQNVTTFTAPSGTTSFTIYFGDTEIAQDDDVFSWTVEDGTVVFTGHAPPDGELVTIVGNYALDFDKVSFPKGYSLDARVFNRTLEDGLATANETWVQSNDLYTENRSSIFPAATTTNDQFVIADNGAWQNVNKTQVATILGAQAFDDVVVDTLLANTSVSSLEVSATTSNIETLTASDFSLLASSYNGTTDEVIRSLGITPEEGTTSAILNSDNVSGFQLSSNYNISFRDVDKEQINASGYYTARAKVQYNNAASLTQLDTLQTDDNNVILNAGYLTAGQRYNSYDLQFENTGSIKAEGVPAGLIKFRYNASLNPFSYITTQEWTTLNSPRLPINSVVNSYYTWNYISNLSQDILYGIKRFNGIFLGRTDGTNSEGPPSFIDVRTLTPAGGYKLYPAILIEFWKDLYDESFDIANEYPSIEIQGQMMLETTRGSAPGVTNIDKNAVSLHPKLWPIGTSEFAQLATAFNNGSYVGSTGDRIPVDNAEAISQGFFAPRRLAILTPFNRDTVSLLSGDNKKADEVVYLVGDTTNDQFTLSADLIILTNE